MTDLLARCVGGGCFLDSLCLGLSDLLVRRASLDCFLDGFRLDLVGLLFLMQLPELALVSSSMKERRQESSDSVNIRPQYFQLFSFRSVMFQGRWALISSGAFPPARAQALK